MSFALKHGAPVSWTVADEIRAEGMDSGEVRALKSAREKEAAMHVHPELWDGLRLLLRSSTQWTYSFNGHRLGLNYTGVKVILDMMNFTNPSKAFEVLQMLEIKVIQQ